MIKTLSNQKRKLTTIRNQVLKARDFDLEKAQLFTTKAILEALKAGKKALRSIGRKTGKQKPTPINMYGWFMLFNHILWFLSSLKTRHLKPINLC